MTKEEKRAYRDKREKIKQKKVEEFKRRENFEKQLKETTLTTFKDKPEEVNTIRCIHVQGDFIVIEWDPPGDNNSPIL